MYTCIYMTLCIEKTLYYTCSINCQCEFAFLISIIVTYIYYTALPSMSDDSSSITVVSVSGTQHTSTVRPSVSKMTHETSMFIYPRPFYISVIIIVADSPSDISSKASFLKGIYNYYFLRFFTIFFNNVGLGVGVGVGAVAASLGVVVTIFIIKIIPKYMTFRKRKGTYIHPS